MAPPASRAFSASVVTLIAVLAAATAFSQFYRNSVGVIATTLASELTLSPDSLGFVTSSFFLIFAFCQIPVGIVIDRYGPRPALLGSSLFVVAGSVVFASASGGAGLVAGRLLLGIGCSTFFMAPLVVYARAFPPRTFASLAGLQLSISSFGTLAATVPLAYATATIGWRSAFLLAGGAAALFGVAVLAVVRGPATGPAAGPSGTLADALRGVAAAARSPGFWAVFFMSFAAYSTFGLLLGLWGGPYLAHIHGADLAGQGRALFLMAAAQIVGTFLWGFADRLVGAYRPIVLTGALGSVAVLMALVLFGHGGAPVRAELLMGLLGLVCAYTPVLVAHGKSLFPPSLTGRGLSLVNIGTMSGSFLTQWGTGLAVKAVAGPATIYPLAAYQTAFTMQALLLAAAAVAYARAPDPRRAFA